MMRMGFTKVLVVFLGIVLVTSLLPLQSVNSATPSFSGRITLSNSGAADTAALPAIAAGAGGNVTVVFEDEGDIRFTNSTNNGASFLPLPAKDIGDENPGVDGSSFPQVGIFGSNVYTVWHGSADRINFTASNDYGLNFVSLRIDDNTTPSQDLDMAISDSGLVYVVWHDNESSGDDIVLFKRSIDNGVNFDSTIIIEDDTDPNDGTNPKPQVATSGDNVYIVWQNATDILVSRSVNNGISFETPVDVGDVPQALQFDIALPQITANGNNVYVSFRSESSEEMKFTKSTDQGITFSTPFVLGNTGVFPIVVDDLIPSQIASSGNNVFVTWINGADNLGVDSDVNFRRSADGGTTWDSSINLSGDSNSRSTVPRLDVEGTNVYVVWQDNQASGTDILFAASSLSGAAGSFPTPIGNLTDTTISSNALNPAIASSGNNIYAVWQDDSTGFSDILFNLGTLSAISIDFDQAKYRIDDTPTVTITAPDPTPGVVDKISVNMTSTTSPLGVIGNVTFTETDVSTGIFTNSSIQFVDDPDTTTDLRLKVSPGDTITAFFQDIGGQTTIFPVDVKVGQLGVDLDWPINSFDNVPIVTDKVFRDKVAGLRVTDQNSNLSPTVAESITVTVKSEKDTTGISLTLTESGVDTGIFGGITGSAQSNLVLQGYDLVGTPTTNAQILVNLTAAVSNGPTITTTIKSLSDQSGVVQIILEHDAPHPIESSLAFYLGNFTTTTGDSNDASDTIKTADGDVVELDFGILALNLFILISPQESDSGVIEVRKIFEEPSEDDNLSVIHNGKTIIFSVDRSGTPGGGGGGGASAGLIVNALAGISLSGGGGADGSPPITSLGTLITNKNFEIPSEIEQIVSTQDPLIPLEPIPLDTYDFDYPLSINENGFALGQYSNTVKTTSLKTGEPVSLTTLFYEQTAIQHVSMYLNLRDITSGDLAKSDTQILYNKDKPLQIIDPNGYFDKVNVIITEDEDTIKKFATFEIVFAKSMEKSDIVLRAWDDRLQSRDTIILDAIQVFDEESFPVDAAPEVETSTISTSPESVETPIPTDTPIVPEWIKNNAEWWSQGEVDDTTFKNAIGFLIEQQIIDIPTGPNVSVSTEGLSVDEKRALEEEAQRVTPIPDWVKNTAEWWYLGDVTEDEFLMSIEYLIKNGVIEI